MANKTFNPEEWLPKKEATTPPSAALAAPVVANPSDQTASPEDIPKHVEIVTQRIETEHIDITSDYNDWIHAMFALIFLFGEGARSYVHRISQFYPGYDPAETDAQFDKCLKSTGSGITIKTFFQIARDHGISVFIPDESYDSYESSKPSRAKNEKASAALSEDAPAELEDIEEMEDYDLPTFTDKFRYPIPGFCKKVTDTATSIPEADMLLLAALVAASSCLDNVSGTYKRRQVFPNLYAFITAEAGIGKGALVNIRHIIEPIHDALHHEFKEEYKEYKRKLAAYNATKPNERGGLEQPEEPPVKFRILPGNSTSAAMRQGLFDNNGMVMIIDTEGDILADSFKSELGNYSADFRKAYHHEPISYYRKQDHDLIEIRQPRISTILSGTPRQIRNLIADAENGLFSRFLFYRLPANIVWEDPLTGDDRQTLDDYYRDLGTEFYDFYTLLTAAQPIRFHVTQEQADQFNQWFSDIQLRYSAAFGNAIIGSVRRLGLATFRIAMVFSILRIMDDGCFEENITCLDEDYDNAMTIAKVLMEHIVHIFRRLPQPSQDTQEVKMTLTKQRFWDALPAEFDTKTFNEIAVSQGLAGKTAEKYIYTWVKTGQLIRVAQGKYAKGNSTIRR